MISDVHTHGIVAGTAAKRGVLLLAAAVSMLISLACAQPAFAFELSADSEAAADNKGFSWTINSNGLLTVTNPTDEVYASYFGGGEVDTVLTVPSAMGGQTVTEILAGSTNTVSAIKTLQYPKTITVMQGTTMGAFPTRFPTLTDFEFVGEGDIALTTVGRTQVSGRGPHFPSTLVRFNAGEVDGIYYDVVIPSSVTAIWPTSFNNIASSSLYIPASVAPTSYSTSFRGLSNLTVVTNASDVWVSFTDCPNITDLTMLGTYTSITASAFSGWVNLESFTVPSGITSIGSNAFKDCVSLTSFTVDGTELLSIGDNAFSGTQSLRTLTLPDSVTTIGAGAFADSSIEAVVLPDSVTDIGAGAFANSAITAIKLPASLFQGLDASQFTAEFVYGSLIIGRTSPLFVANFSDDDQNSILTSVDLLSYQQSFLPSFMFAGCTALEEIAIPKTVTSLMAGAFFNCTSLQDVYYFGDPSAISIAETQKVMHPFEYEYIAAGAFSAPDGGVDPDGLGPTYAMMEGIAFYGLGISENNALKAYAEENGCTYVPFAFLGDGGSSEDVQAKFGYSAPANTVSIADIATGETPTVTVGYPSDPTMSRTLVPGTAEAAGDCTITYTLGGKEVFDFYTPGVYTATITGDNESVWGTTTTTFTVSAPDVVTIPVSGDTGVTARGSLYGSNVPADADVSLVINSITSGTAYDALMAAKGTGVMSGAFEAYLLVNGQQVHDNFGTIVITFPVDAQYNGYWATIWHRHADGTITSERTTVSNGKVSTTVTDLSTFAIEIGEKAATESEGLDIPDSATPKPLVNTGDPVPFIPLMAFTGASVLALGAAALARRKGRHDS